MMRGKEEGIDRARAEDKSKARPEDNTKTKYGGQSHMVLEILSTA